MRTPGRYTAIISIAIVSIITAAPAIFAQGQTAESLPHTEQLEAGTLTLPRLSDRQLVALLIDLNKRSQFDRDQHAGVAGPDASYLQDWTSRVINEMEIRHLAADPQGSIR